jgi:hypothetical protein
MKTIVIVIVYMGKLPEWFPLFLATCKCNPSISWQIYGDRLDGYSSVPNVSLRTMTIRDFLLRASQRLSIPLAYEANGFPAYKITDFKPAYGVLFENEIQGYDFWGYGDIDVLYGDIRSFYTDSVLSNQVISSHELCVAGHLSLLRNESYMRSAFQRVNNWRTALCSAKNVRFDEDVFFTVFQYPKRISLIRRKILDLFDPVGKKLRQGNYFVEQYTTPLTPSLWYDGQVSHPRVWYWSRGKIYNDRDGPRQFLYLHFMNYKYNRYMNPIYGNKAPWGNLRTVMHINESDFSNGARVDFDGIHALSRDDLEYLASVTNLNN